MAALACYPVELSVHGSRWIDNTPFNRLFNLATGKENHRQPAEISNQAKEKVVEVDYLSLFSP